MITKCATQMLFKTVLVDQHTSMTFCDLQRSPLYHVGFLAPAFQTYEVQIKCAMSTAILNVSFSLQQIIQKFNTTFSWQQSHKLLVTLSKYSQHGIQHRSQKPHMHILCSSHKAQKLIKNGLHLPIRLF